MALTERRILNQITILPAQNAVNVQWSNQILRDEEIIGESFERKSYTADMASEFIADVEGSGLYLAALGWPNSPEKTSA